MIVQEKFLSKLKDFGLNSYESKLWTALLSRGVSTAGELSDIANVPRSRTYDVLESLEKKGFIIMKLGKPIKYLAVSPSEVIERVKKKVGEEAQVKVGILESIKESEVLTELTLLHKQGLDVVEPSDYSGVVKGRNNIYNHMETMIKGAKESVIICTSKEGLMRKSKALKKVLQSAKRRGVNVNIHAPLTKDNEAHQNELKELATISHKKKEGSRYCITDGKELLFMLLDEDKIHPNFEVGVWVNAPSFADDIHTMTLSSLK